jgi:hypothetical protein
MIGISVTWRKPVRQNSFPKIFTEMQQPFFEYLVKPVANYYKYDLSKFSFNDPTVPLTSASEVIAALAIYYSMVYFLPRQSYKLKWLFFAHNALLSVGSFILLALILESLLPQFLDNGLVWVMCHHDCYNGRDSRLEFYFYVNYLFKYYELLDTLFMILKGKKVR